MEFGPVHPFDRRSVLRRAELTASSGHARRVNAGLTGARDLPGPPRPSPLDDAAWARDDHPGLRRSRSHDLKDERSRHHLFPLRRRGAADERAGAGRRAGDDVHLRPDRRSADGDGRERDVVDALRRGRACAADDGLVGCDGHDGLRAALAAITATTSTPTVRRSARTAARLRATPTIRRRPRVWTS